MTIGEDIVLRLCDNAQSLAVIREEAGDEAFRRICERLCGERVLFPHRRGGLPIKARALQYLHSGYSPARIAKHLGCDVSYVYRIKRTCGQNALQCPKDDDRVGA